MCMYICMNACNRAHQNTKKPWPKNFKSIHTWTFNWEDRRYRAKGRIFGLDGWRCQGITMNAEGHGLVKFPNTKIPPKKAPKATAAPVSKTLAEVMHFLGGLNFAIKINFQDAKE